MLMSSPANRVRIKLEFWISEIKQTAVSKQVNKFAIMPKENFNHSAASFIAIN